MKTTEPNQALQTISRTVPVAAEPLCGPALEMSDFKRSAKNMKTYPIWIASILALAGCNHAPHEKRYVIDMELSKIAYDGTGEEELGPDRQMSVGRQIRLIEVGDKKATIELLWNGFKSEAKEGERFPYQNGYLSCLTLLKADQKEQSIRISLPFGDMKTLLKVIYNDGTYKEIQQ